MNGLQPELPGVGPRLERDNGRIHVSQALPSTNHTTHCYDRRDSPRSFQTPLARDRRRSSSAETETARYEALLLDSLPLINRLVSSTCWRMGIRATDAEDLRGEVLLKLIERDYRVLRRYSGQGRLSSYLRTVVSNLARDRRIKELGKWRPSAQATRLGTTAVRLEKLLYRDRWSFGEATALLRQRHGCTETEDQLDRIAASLPPRTKRQSGFPELLDQLASPSESPDLALSDHNQLALSSLSAELQRLSPLDRLFLRTRFTSGLTVADLARSTGLDQRKIYARIQQCLSVLRGRLTRDSKA